MKKYLDKMYSESELQGIWIRGCLGTQIPESEILLAMVSHSNLMTLIPTVHLDPLI